MHLTVGYLATLTGDDGVALAGALATTFDAQVDVILVVREELPDGHPGRAEYQHFLIERGEEWISKAIDALAAKGVSATSTVLVGESYAESLIEFAQQNLKRDVKLIYTAPNEAAAQAALDDCRRRLGRQVSGDQPAVAQRLVGVRPVPGLRSLSQNHVSCGPSSRPFQDHGLWPSRIVPRSATSRCCCQWI